MNLQKHVGEQLPDGWLPSFRGLWVMIVLGGLSAFLVGCGNPPKSSKEYQDHVLEVLRGDPLQDTGLGQMLSETAGDLECEGSHCTTALYFQFLEERANERRAIVRDYEGRLCNNSKVLPPKALQDQHHALCSQLNAFFKSLDAILTNSDTARKLLGPTGGQAADSLLQEFAHRLAREQQNILHIHEKLREIDWLRPIL